MSLAFCVLGSGSGGNSTLVKCGGACLLIDCGLSPRATNKRLASLNADVCIDNISAILLTHFDADHFYPGWIKPIRLRHIPVFVHRQHRKMAWRFGLTAKHVSLYNGGGDIDLSQSHNGAFVRTMLLSHDDLGTVSFVIQRDGMRLGYATDVGHVPPTLFEHFHDLHALAIESNYDRDMQINSGRPAFLKRRIMGGSGHLSNEQALEAVAKIAQRSPLSHIALLHLSRECNCPNLLRRLYRKLVPQLTDRLTITDQFEPSPLLEVKIGKLSPGCAATLAHTQAQRQLPLFAHLLGTPVEAKS
jgi:phosphoribosyl 1,2-cyclic phosphodiesterase